MLRRSVCCLDGPNIIGGRVQGLPGTMRSVIQPCLAENVLREAAAVRKRIADLTEMNTADDDGKTTYKPTLPRAWVKAPLSRLSTSLSRRDWFRLMQFNIMTDAWNKIETGTEIKRTATTTTPVQGVQVHVPGFTRSGEDPDAFVSYDPSLDTEVPPFLQPDFKRAYLVNEIRYYDPDIVCLQEVNRSFFNNVLWKYVRYCGYGTLYQSSRGYKVRALRKGDDPNQARHKGKIEEGEDIGNVVLFHKGRFVPILMPGKDLVQHFHFAHIVSMRDKVTNMTLNVACIQFTAGDSQEAMQIRLHEARQTIQILDALNRNDADRAHMSNVICGDLNNIDDEEACVQFIRERLFSTYDVVGGPRWTAWFHQDQKGNAKYQKYYDSNRECFEQCSAAKRAERAMAKYAKTRERISVKGETTASVSAELVNEKNSDESMDMEQKNIHKQGIIHDKKHKNKKKEVQPQENKKKEETKREDEGEKEQDALAVKKEVMKKKGIISRTQDFIFYDPQTLALHQVLDVPEEKLINEQQLLPCSNHPSHHIHLVIDVSFNDVHPDVGSKSLKD
ncbi:Endonuclease/exonuclease/phosphatase [Trypanosoma melophagium]|uniref:Endonuclease/exonuclease/phosphatase n=1 Tax=Trypanosoma melophagium TaxID=715481 RepID=UPI00351A7368|nr:Endonuclease/exonuclease/phosphatase [Trypanosoma melophagium]